jgi:hypothetical protein
MADFFEFPLAPDELGNILNSYPFVNEAIYTDLQSFDIQALVSRHIQRITEGTY